MTVKINTLQFAIARWLALANSIIGFLFLTYIPFLVGTNIEIFLIILDIISTLIIIYLFIVFNKLLKTKYKIDVVSRDIYVIIMIIIFIIIFGYLEHILFSDVLKNNTYNSLYPVLGLLNFVYFIFKIVLGFVLIQLANKLDKLKANLNGLETFRTILKISGALYLLSGFAAHYGRGLSLIAETLISVIFSSLFLKVPKDTEKSVTEILNNSTQG